MVTRVCLIYSPWYTTRPGLGFGKSRLGSTRGDAGPLPAGALLAGLRFSLWLPLVLAAFILPAAALVGAFVRAILLSFADSTRYGGPCRLLSSGMRLNREAPLGSVHGSLT